MAAYSFLDINASLSGADGSINLGAGASVSEEGISIEPMEDKSVMTIGADGNGMHSLVANEASTVTIRLLKTSPVNAQLMQMFTAQSASSAKWGKNTITVRNAATGDSITLQEVAFKKRPSITYAKEGGMNEWAFDAIKTDTVLGTGTPEA